MEYTLKLLYMYYTSRAYNQHMRIILDLHLYIYIYTSCYICEQIRFPPYFYNPLTTLVTTFFLVTALDNKLFISIFCVELTG